MSKYDVIHKTGSTQRITTPPEEDRATAVGTCTKNLVKTGRVLLLLTYLLLLFSFSVLQFLVVGSVR